MGHAAPGQTDATAASWDGVVLVAAFMAGASALVHLAVAPAHFAERWLLGALFVVAATLELSLAGLLIRRPSPGRAAALAAVNLGLVITWLVSRTTGLPLGPGARAPEAAGLVDLLTTVEEVVLVLLLLVGGRAASHRGRGLAICQGVGGALGVTLTLIFAGGLGGHA